MPYITFYYTTFITKSQISSKHIFVLNTIVELNSKCTFTNKNIKSTIKCTILYKFHIIYSDFLLKFYYFFQHLVFFIKFQTQQISKFAKFLKNIKFKCTFAYYTNYTLHNNYIKSNYICKWCSINAYSSAIYKSSQIL